jgi:hypothetical protein
VSSVLESNTLSSLFWCGVPPTSGSYQYVSRPSGCGGITEGKKGGGGGGKETKKCRRKIKS